MCSCLSCSLVTIVYQLPHFVVGCDTGVVLDDGFVELDMEVLPEGFLNPYGGQYSIGFIDPDTNQVIDFMALDGKIYDSICLTFQVAYTNLETIIISINAINNDTLDL